MNPKKTWLMLAGITLLAFAIRLSFFSGSRFPLHDGGFFYVMVEDLISNRFALPAYSTFNQAQIPFLYPPLGLYLAGLIEHLTGASRLGLFRIIPLVFATLTIPAFFCLARELLKNERAALTGTAVYSLLPRAYMWLVLGGGVTRAPGAFFGILALTCVARYMRCGGWKAMIAGCVLSGLCVLSHPEWGWFLFYSIGLLALIEIISKGWTAFLRALLLFLGTAALTLPWLLAVWQRHGRSVLLPLLDSGFSRWEGAIRLILLDWSGEALFPVMTLLALIGMAALAKKREWFAVLWLPLVFLLQGRAPDQKAVLALALAGGEGITVIAGELQSRASGWMKARRGAIIALGAYAYALVSGLITASPLVQPLAEMHLESIEWIREEIPADAQLLVITGKDWIFDNYSEWMAALSGRSSAALVQGYEWLPDFSERISRYEQAQNEYAQGMEPLTTWLEQAGMRVDYLVLPKGEGADFIQRASEPALHWQDAQLYPGVEKVYENERVLILDLKKVFNP